jgi:hypothetical protein
MRFFSGAREYMARSIFIVYFVLQYCIPNVRAIVKEKNQEQRMESSSRAGLTEAALYRTNNQHVCYRPTSSSRQDRRRLHRQGRQRQVHDGLAPARQQVRIARLATRDRRRMKVLLFFFEIISTRQGISFGCRALGSPGRRARGSNGKEITRVIFLHPGTPLARRRR